MTLSADEAKEYIDTNRIKAIAESVSRRIDNLKKIAVQHPQVQRNSTEDDVEENIARMYSSKTPL